MAFLNKNTSVHVALLFLTKQKDRTKKKILLSYDVPKLKKCNMVSWTC